MNTKTEYINNIINIVYECCVAEIDNKGSKSFSIDDLLGQVRTENVVMTRCILVMLILREGFSVTTCSIVLHRTAHAISNLHKKSQDYLATSRAFKIAYIEAATRVDKIKNEMNLG